MNPTADLTVPSGHQYGQLRDGADLKHAGEFDDLSTSTDTNMALP